MYKIITIFALCFITFGCTLKSHKSRAGDCDPIVPSLNEYQFNKTGGSIEIKTINPHWWIIDRIEHYPITENIEFIREENEGSNGKVIEIKSDWFVVKKETSQKLFIKFEPNQTGSNRWIKLDLQAGNCFSMISISQSAE